MHSLLRQLDQKLLLSLITTLIGLAKLESCSTNTNRIASKQIFYNCAETIMRIQDVPRLTKYFKQMFKNYTKQFHNYHQKMSNSVLLVCLIPRFFPQAVPSHGA